MHIGFAIFSLGVGGAERVATTLVNEWVRRGDEVTLLTIDSRDRDFYPLDPRVRRVGLELNISAASWRESVSINLRRLAKMRSFTRIHKFDVMVSFCDKTNVLLLLAVLGLKLPIIVGEHTDPRKYKIGAIARSLRRLLYPRARVVIVLTEEIGQWARKFVRGEAVRIIPNPVGEQCLAGAQPVPRGPQRCVLAMGRMGFEKGFDLLLQAFALCADKFPDWTLRLVGQGEEEQRLRELAKQLRIERAVRFEPVTKEPARVLRESDLFVLSSRLEGFPMVLLEAMACGLPVVSFDCMSGGPREMIRHGIDGLLVQPEDVGELANAMEKLMANEYERRGLAERAREVTERFGLTRVMGMWDEVFAYATKGPAGGNSRAVSEVSYSTRRGGH